MTRVKAAQLITEKAIQKLQNLSNVSISMLNYGMNADNLFMKKLEAELPPWITAIREPFSYICFTGLPKANADFPIAWRKKCKSPNV